MDSVQHWKRILLQWVRECSFLDKQFYSIEQSEIETFFVKFRDRIKGEIGRGIDLSTFLKEHYPLFEPHFDDEKALSSNDYVYVYSLLLHFSCVKCPDEFFQKNCQVLNEAVQQNITTFFTKLLDANSITKETLRHAIASITPFKAPNSRLVCMDSPLRTPRRMEISPPTPRSCRLQEKSKELLHLRAQFEQEAYDKGILELELKQQQEKISKLNREVKRYQQELHVLKNDMLMGSTDSDSECRHSEEEQINRRLNKLIAEKEAEISKQQDEIDNLSEEKDLLNEKLSHAEKQMKLLQHQIEELVLKVDELADELEQKEVMIQHLTETKLELEHYITEVRSSSASSRPDLNISVDCLDMSRTTNSSGSVNSPENLGSVVDMQLREKEAENVQLREEIATIRLDNSKLSQHMTDLTMRYSKCFEICKENLIADYENSDPVESFMVFSNYVKNLVQKYEDNCALLNEHKERAKAKDQQNVLLSSRVEELQNELTDLQFTNKTLEAMKSDLETIVSVWTEKFNTSVQERSKVEESYEALKKEMEDLKAVKELEIVDLKAKVKLQENLFAELKIDMQNKDASLKSLESEVNDNRERNQALLSQIEQMNAEKKNLIALHEAEVSQLADKLKEALLENEKKIQELQKDREQQVSDLMVQLGETEKRLTEEIRALETENASKIVGHERENSRLMNDLESLRSLHASEVNQLEDKLKEAMVDNEKKIQELEQNREQQAERLSEEIKALEVEKTNKIIAHEEEKTRLINEVECLRAMLNEAELENEKKIQELEQDREQQAKRLSEEIKAVEADKTNQIVQHEEENSRLAIELESIRALRESDVSQLTEALLEHEKKIQELEQDRQEIKAVEADKTNQIVEYEREKASLTNELENLKALHESEVSQLKEVQLEHKRKIQELEQSREHQVNNLKSQSSETEKRLREEIKAIEAEKSQKLVDYERESTRLTIELKEMKHNLDSVSNEKNVLEKNANDNKQRCLALQKALKESEDEVQKLIANQQQLQADKEALIRSIEERIDALKLSLDQCNHSFKEQINRSDKQNADALKKLSSTEDELNERQMRLVELSAKCKDLEGVLAAREEELIASVNEIESHLQVILEKMDSTNDLNENDLFKLSSDSSSVFENLKQHLNALIQRSLKMMLLNANYEDQVTNLSENVREISQQKIEIQRKILELREDFESESLSEQNKLTNEVNRLNGDISNLEKVCDRLTEQNTTLQGKLSELVSLNEDLTKENNRLQKNSDILETERTQQLSLAEKLMTTKTELQAQIVDMQASAKELEIEIGAAQRLLLEKTHDAEVLLKERDQAEGTIASMKQQIAELATLISETNEKYDTALKLIQENCDDKCKQLEHLQVQLECEVAEKQRIRQELEIAKERVVELTSKKTFLDSKCQVVDTQLEQYKHDLERTRTELITLQCEQTRLLAEIQLVKDSKVTSEAQLETCNKEISEQKENVSRLIREIASIRREKDAVEEEKSRLVLRFEEKANVHQSLDANFKSMSERLQLSEKDLVAKQNALKTEQAKSACLERQLAKLQAEHAKLKETSETSIKRMEKQALRLGEQQAKTLRLKKDTELAQSLAETLKSSAEVTQRENAKLNLECKTLKEKLSKMEKASDQLESKLQQLTAEHEALCAEKQNKEASENLLKLMNTSLEKTKSNLEDKVRKLAKSLSDTNVALGRLEQDKVQLNLEVGGLNKQLHENKSLLSMRQKEIQDVTANLIEAKNVNQNLMQLNEKLQLDASDLGEENSRLNDQLSKLQLRLEIAQNEHESTKKQLESLQAEIEVKMGERCAIEREHLATIQRLKEAEQLADERHSTESHFVEKINSLEGQLAQKAFECCNLEEMRKQEKLNNEKLATDISILQAKLQKSRAICEENERKWAEEKEQMLAELRSSDERIKETRLELEGKLDKMKSKMKTLYNDEITKIKNKQESEMAVLKSNCEVLKTQNKKYEEHTKKLSNQVFKLNENILEHQKQNTFLKTKLKDLESSKPLTRLPSASGSSYSSQGSSTHQALSTNLHMEDEQGEVFNNTYLSDLKDGRMSDLFSRDICAQELQYRNSLLPPHLKSAYLAQFDHQMGEDEIRESPSLDDSLSTLLNTGQRKKVSGATSYKRPGPPTPSKNAGRLSFGGNAELNREILKETLDMGNYTISSKTPARFKLFSSIMHNSTKDENKNCVTVFKRKNNIVGTILCSSTPRKSKAHFDQRRLLDQIMSTANNATEDSPYQLVSPAANLPPTLSKLDMNRRISQKWRQPQPEYATPETDFNSPICNDSPHENANKRSKRRCSLYLRCNMFARNYRTPNKGTREAFRIKSKMQRNANFNKYRRENLNQLIVKRASICLPCEPDNNNSYKNIKELVVESSSKEDNLWSYNSGTSDDLLHDDPSSRIFQQLLTKKESRAPFEISEINGPVYLKSNSSSTVHSRTIYGASVILNRRIPNVNTTLVRKSSIYVKGKDGRGIILVTNQTITLVDLAHMWMQMNVPAQVVIVLVLMAFCLSLFSVFRELNSRYFF